MKKILILLSIIGLAACAGWRIQQLGDEEHRQVNNIVRIQAAKGAPKHTVVAKQTTDFLEEPLFVERGRALVSANRINKFRVGQAIKDSGAVIKSISRNIDLDSGMFIVRLSETLTGNMFVLSEYTGFFLPLDAELPKNAQVVAKDASRQVVAGITEGTEIRVK